jgi:Na+:H+ antiporter, NhaA family
VQEKIKNTAKYIPDQIASILNLLLRDEAIGGKLLLVAAAVALIVVNSPLQHAYESLWHVNLSLGLGNFSISEDLRHWVNDGLMALFFLVVGLEIKREMVRGELRKPRVAALPIAAAIGGMLIPALIYVAFNMGSDSLRGWGIPIATDIAFAIGVLALLGPRVPPSLKIFLLTLAIVDDLLAIIIIALFYTSGIHLTSLVIAAVIVGCFIILNHLRKHTLPMYVLLGICLWLAIKNSGVHATIAGALLGFLAPMKATTGPPIAERVERSIIPFTTLIVVPLFAFANAGVIFGDVTLTSKVQPIVWGVALGLVLGKTFGVIATTWLLTRIKLADLPKGLNWGHITGIGMLAGIGFTVSIFITELAFKNQIYISGAKVAIIAASIVAAIIGSLTLLISSRKSQKLTR